MKTTEDFKKMLLRRRHALDRRLHSADIVLTASHSQDWEDQAVEREGEEVVEALSDNDRTELRSIEAALKRIEDGTFGVCARCGEAILEDRLLTLPETPFCRTCARAAD